MDSSLGMVFPPFTLMVPEKDVYTFGSYLGKGNVMWSKDSLKNFVLQLLFCVLAFIFFCSFFPRWYDGDGLKYLIWNYQTIVPSSNSHALTPYWFYGWWSLIGPFASQKFADKMFWLAMFNNLNGAIAATLIVNLIKIYTHSLCSGLTVGLLLCVTSAFFYHATQTTEPMIALLLFLMAWRLLLTSHPISLWCILFSSTLFSLSVASYLTYGTGLVLLLHYLYKKSNKYCWIWLAASLAIGVFIFIVCSILNGKYTISDIATYSFNYLFFLPKEAQNYWGFIKPERLITMCLGFSDAIVATIPIDIWPGLRQGWLLLSWQDILWIMLKLMIAMTVFLGTILWIYKKRKDLRGELLTFLLALFPLFYWDPYYYKLWLLPLSIGILLFGVVIANFRRGWIVAALLVFCIAAINWNTKYNKYHRTDNPQATALKQLESHVAPQDLLVCDGWDHSAIYLAKYPQREAHPVILPNKNAQTLQQHIKKIAAHGGKVWFYGILNLSIEEWRLSIGKFNKLDYDSFNYWREHAVLVWDGKHLGCTKLYYYVP